MSIALKIKEIKCSTHGIYHWFIKVKTIITTLTHWRGGFFTTRKHKLPFSFGFVFLVSQVELPPLLDCFQII